MERTVGIPDEKYPLRHPSFQFQSLAVDPRKAQDHYLQTDTRRLVAFAIVVVGSYAGRKRTDQSPFRLHFHRP